MINPVILRSSNWLHSRHFSEGSSLRKCAGHNYEDTPNQGLRPSVDQNSTQITGQALIHQRKGNFRTASRAGGSWAYAAIPSQLDMYVRAKKKICAKLKTLWPKLVQVHSMFLLRFGHTLTEVCAIVFSLYWPRIGGFANSPSLEDGAAPRWLTAARRLLEDSISYWSILPEPTATSQGQRQRGRQEAVGEREKKEQQKSPQVREKSWGQGLLWPLDNTVLVCISMDSGSSPKRGLLPDYCPRWFRFLAGCTIPRSIYRETGELSACQVARDGDALRP